MIGSRFCFGVGMEVLPKVTCNLCRLAELWALGMGTGWAGVKQWHVGDIRRILLKTSCEWNISGLKMPQIVCRHPYTYQADLPLNTCHVVFLFTPGFTKMQNIPDPGRVLTPPPYSHPFFLNWFDTLSIFWSFLLPGMHICTVHSIIYFCSILFTFSIFSDLLCWWHSAHSLLLF
jgi:hypothetical protein